MNGIELQDREFFAAIRERREPNSSVDKVLACYQVLGQLKRHRNHPQRAHLAARAQPHIDPYHPRHESLGRLHDLRAGCRHLQSQACCLQSPTRA